MLHQVSGKYQGRSPGRAGWRSLSRGQNIGEFAPRSEIFTVMFLQCVSKLREISGKVPGPGRVEGVCHGGQNIGDNLEFTPSRGKLLKGFSRYRISKRDTNTYEGRAAGLTVSRYRKEETQEGGGEPEVQGLRGVPQEGGQREAAGQAGGQGVQA